MNPIFISYRREDGIDTAQLLHLHLQKIFGDEAVFLDTAELIPGDEYPLRLEAAVKYSKVVIVMIGNHWKGKDPQINRLKIENDWVCKELKLALDDKNKKIFPLFVQGASINDAFIDLPDELMRLSQIESSELRSKEFKTDLNKIIPLIEPYVSIDDPLKELPIDIERFRFPLGSPFKGLEYFKEEDALIFFGRGAEIKKLYNKIKNSKILFLYGQSGSGKSSLLFAGLKPRLEYKGWNICYLRQEVNHDLSKNLSDILDRPASGRPQLVILDQVEEIISNSLNDISFEREMLALSASVRRANQKDFHIILGFRKEYLPDIEKWFLDMTFGKMYLEPLQLKGVLEAIQGIDASNEAKDHYELSFSDNEVPMLIANSVMADEESHIAPLLQMILRKMWDNIAFERNRVFSKELLNQVKADNLGKLLSDQIDLIGKKFPNQVASGLVLDLLHFFTTSRGTAASRTNEELKAQYGMEYTMQIITELKNTYLLSEPRRENTSITRLAHDAMAPIIRELYSRSALPGQKASRILEAKRHDIEDGLDVEFSKSDLATIDTGRTGMRMFTAFENSVVENSRLRIVEADLDRQFRMEEKQREVHKKESERRSIENLNIDLSINMFEQIVNEIKDQKCLLVLGDKVILDSDYKPLITYLFDASIKKNDNSVSLDRKNNLLSFKGTMAEWTFRRKITESFKKIEYKENELPNKLSAIPFCCYLNFGIDLFLKQTFKLQRFPFIFYNYEETGDSSFNLLTKNQTFRILKERPFIVNFLGTIEQSGSIPFSPEAMRKRVRSIQKGDYLPLAFKSLMQDLRTIIFIGVNWDAWYVESLVHWIKAEFRGQRLDLLILRDTIHSDNVVLLNELQIRSLNLSENEFVNKLYEEFEKRKLLRKPQRLTKPS